MDQPGGRFEKGDVILGKLEVIRVLGEGGMGIVYEVEHRMTKHRRALKLLHSHISKDSQVTARLLREASVAGTLRTKHVVETFDAGQLEDGAAYVLMEMLEGQSFAEVLEAGRPPVGRVVSILWEACEGLAVAHQKSIVHRDLKPDNMFVAKDLDGNEIVKILDFGISKFAENHDYHGTLTAEGSVMGTPFYMSPEQTRGVKEIDGRTDIYALGVILYEAIAGKVPFLAESFPMLVVSIHEGNYEPLDQVVPDVDPALAAVVHKAMSKEMADRYASTRDLQEALRPFADRELPERIGTDSALALDATMASDSMAPRLSASQTPMAVDNAKHLAKAPPPKWPLRAGMVLAALGLVGLSVAMAGVGETAVESESVEGVRGVADGGGSVVAAAQPLEVVAPVAGAVVDSGAADADADAGAEGGTERAEVAPVTRMVRAQPAGRATSMAMQMGGTSMTIETDGIDREIEGL